MLKPNVWMIYYMWVNKKKIYSSIHPSIHLSILEILPGLGREGFGVCPRKHRPQGKGHLGQGVDQ